MATCEYQMNDRMKTLYMDLAHRVAQMSRAVRLQVGCVIVKDDNIISFSWNGTPAGFDNDCENKNYCFSRDFNNNYFPGTEEAYPFVDENGHRYALKTKDEVLHAEENAIIKLAKNGYSSQGAELFCTHFCCMSCAKLIAGAGIKKLYWRSKYPRDGGQALKFLEQCGVECEQLS